MPTTRSSDSTNSAADRDAESPGPAAAGSSPPGDDARATSTIERRAPRPARRGGACRIGARRLSQQPLRPPRQQRAHGQEEEQAAPVRGQVLAGGFHRAQHQRRDQRSRRCCPCRRRPRRPAPAPGTSARSRAPAASARRPARRPGRPARHRRQSWRTAHVRIGMPSIAAVSAWSTAARSQTPKRVRATVQATLAAATSSARGDHQQALRRQRPEAEVDRLGPAAAAARSAAPAARPAHWSAAIRKKAQADGEQHLLEFAAAVQMAQHQHLEQLPRWRRGRPARRSRHRDPEAPAAPRASAAPPHSRRPSRRRRALRLTKCISPSVTDRPTAMTNSTMP